MNWGKGITIAIVLFISFIVVLASRMMSQKMDLVSSSYYEEGVEYEQRQYAKGNYAALEVPVNIKATDNFIILNFPEQLKGCTGKIRLYRPDDRAKDLNYEVKLDENGMQKISSHDLAQGRWEVHLMVNDGKQDYYHQTNLYLP